MRAKPGGRGSHYRAVAILIGLLLGLSVTAKAAEQNPLRPPDTSSPRATLQGFIESFDELYTGMAGLLEDYRMSGRLYLSPAEHREQLAFFEDARRAIRALDLSEISPVLQDTLAAERALQLKEILDRIDIPPFADIPDRDAMAREPSKRWRLPNTEIDIVLAENGPRAGDYLVSAETIDRLPEFYERIKDLPYKPGAAQQLSEVYRSMSGGQASTIYEAYLNSPVGLSYIIPPRWMLALPGWAKARAVGVAFWQWLGLGVGLLISAAIIYGARRLARRLTDHSEDATGPSWHALPVPLAIAFVAGIIVPLFDALLRIGGGTRVVIAYTQTGALVLSAAWLAIVASSIIGEAIVQSEHLKARSLDSQLIRLGMRLVGIAVAIGILIRGADELGFPAYSVLAGLGVGGLAVALAARDTIANLIGSLLITLEKPFRVGHVVRVSGSEGTVEDVGFRSTRIRTLDNTLVSIPSSAVVSTTVENLSVRMMRRQRFFVQVTYNTSRETVEALVAGIRKLIVDHPLTDKDKYHVRLNNLSESSLDILVMFHLRVADANAELEEREAMLLQIIDLVKAVGAEFAFPSRTLYVETPAPAESTASPILSRWAAS